MACHTSKWSFVSGRSSEDCDVDFGAYLSLDFYADFGADFIADFEMDFSLNP